MGRFVLSSPVQTFIIVVILVNAVILGLETSPAVTESFGGLLHVLDKICLGIFLIEIALKLYAERLGFLRNAWNVFDFLVIGVALIPGADGFAVLRALRVLRVLRLISVIPSLRRVVDALVRAVPGIVSIAALLVIVFYVGASLFSLFQIMTLDSWSALARTVSAEIPWAPAFFVPFVLISALTVLNLFIAVIVDAMQGLDEDRVRNGEAPVHEVTVGGHGEAAVLAELRELRAQVAQLTQSLESGARPARE